MAINKKLLYFKKAESFETARQNDQILDKSIAYVNDSKPFIYTHQAKFAAYNPTSFLLQNSIDWSNYGEQSISFDPSTVSLEDFVIINSEPCKILAIGNPIYVINKEGVIAKLSNTTLTVLQKNSNTYVLSSVTDLTATSFTEDISQIQLGDNISIQLEDKMDSNLVFTLYSKYAVEGTINYRGTCFKDQTIYNVVLSPDTKNITFSECPNVPQYVEEAISKVVVNQVEVQSNIDQKPVGNLLIVNDDLSNDEFPTANYTTAISPIYLKYQDNIAYLQEDTSVVNKVVIECPIAENTKLEAGNDLALTLSNSDNRIQLEGHHITEEGESYSYYYQIPNGNKDGSVDVLALRSDIPKVSCISIFSGPVAIDSTLQSSGTYNKTLAESFFKYAEITTEDRAYTFSIQRDSDIQRVTTKNYFITSTNESSIISSLYTLEKALAFTFQMPVPIKNSDLDTAYQNRQFTLLIAKSRATTTEEGGTAEIIYKYGVSSESAVGAGDSYNRALKLIV